MQSIDEILNQAAQDTVTHLGLPVFVNGIKYFAVRDDVPIEGASGIQRKVILSFRREDIPLIKKDDSVIFEGNTFKVERVQRDNVIDPLVDVEIKSVTVKNGL